MIKVFSAAQNNKYGLEIVLKRTKIFIDAEDNGTVFKILEGQINLQTLKKWQREIYYIGTILTKETENDHLFLQNKITFKIV